MIRWLQVHYPHAVLASGFDDAIIGMLHRPRRHAVAVYDYRRMVEMVEREGVSTGEAVAYLEVYRYGAFRRLEAGGGLVEGHPILNGLDMLGVVRHEKGG